MPLYEYWCSECKSQFEKLRPMSSKDSEVKCPKCGSGVKRMLSVVAALSRSDEGYAMSGGSGGGCACGRGGCGCGGH